MAQDSIRNHEQLTQTALTFESKFEVLEPTQINDYFVEKDGQRFAGTHLLVDLWEAKYLTDKTIVEHALRQAAASANATALHVHLNKFTENGGVSGVLILAESHISIHTWPERSFAAVDIFMCGSCNPHSCIDVLNDVFEPARIILVEQRRGLLP